MHNNNKTSLNISTKPKNHPSQIQRFHGSYMETPSNSMQSSIITNNNIKRSNIIKRIPSVPNNSPYPSKTFDTGNFNKMKNINIANNEHNLNQQPTVPTPQENNTWNDMLSVNSCKSESSVSTTLYETRKNKNHKSHSHRYNTKKNDMIGEQKPSTDRKVNLLIFNPHHTLQFLVSELKSHLRSPKSDEKNVHKILSEIQQTIKRLESSNSQISDTISTSNSTQENHKNQENRVNKTNNSSCQTDNNNLSICEIVNTNQTDKSHNNDNNNKKNEFENSKFKIKMEIFEVEMKKNCEKLTQNCKILEKTCKSLHEDKTKLSSELSKCQIEISTLQNQISNLQGELKDVANQEKSATQNLKEQYKTLQDQLKTLQDSITKKEADELLAEENLSIKFKESSGRISALEKTGIDSRKMLILTKLENEKLAIMEKFRTHQINSMQNNINDIHKFIRHELKELQEYLCNGSSNKDITKAISQIKSNKISKLFDETLRIKNNTKIKIPLKKLSTLKTNIKSHPSMNSNLIKPSLKSIKHSNCKIENIMTSARSDSGSTHNIHPINETLILPMSKQLPSGNGRDIMIGMRIIDVKNENQPSETSEIASSIEKSKENYNKIVMKNQENVHIENDIDDYDDDDIIIPNDINTKNLQENYHQKHYKNLKEKTIISKQNKNDSIPIVKNSKNFKKFQFTNKNVISKISTIDSYNLFENDKSNLMNSNRKNLTTFYVGATETDINGDIRLPLKTSGTIPIKKPYENRKSLKKTQHHPTTNIEIPLPNLNIQYKNRQQHFHSDDDNDEHKRQRNIIDSNEFNKKKFNNHNKHHHHNHHKNLNENYIICDKNEYKNDSNNLNYLNDPTNSNSTYHHENKIIINDDNNYYHKNINDKTNKFKDKNTNRNYCKMSSSSSNKRNKIQQLLLQQKQYYWSKVNGSNVQNDQNDDKQQSDKISGCGDNYFTHVTPEQETSSDIPILKYTSNFDEFRNMLDDVIPFSDEGGGCGGGISEKNRNNNNNKIYISSDLNNSTSFDLTECTDV